MSWEAAQLGKGQELCLDQQHCKKSLKKTLDTHD